MFELINLHPNNDEVALHLQFLQGGSLDTGSVYDYYAVFQMIVLTNGVQKLKSLTQKANSAYSELQII